MRQRKVGEGERGGGAGVGTAARGGGLMGRRTCRVHCGENYQKILG